MTAKITRRFPEKKDYRKTYMFTYTFPADNLDGFGEGNAFIIADSPEEASRAAKDFILKSNKRRKESKINEATLEDCRGNNVLSLRAADVALLS